jgi:hypothetical protein
MITKPNSWSFEPNSNKSIEKISGASICDRFSDDPSAQPGFSLAPDPWPILSARSLSLRAPATSSAFGIWDFLGIWHLVFGHSILPEFSFSRERRINSPFFTDFTLHNALISRLFTLTKKFFSRSRTHSVYKKTHSNEVSHPHLRSPETRPPNAK